MKKIIILLIVISFTIAVEHVVQTYENGMPQVIKVYNSYGNKLSLIKETGYYSDGSKQYAKTINNDPEKYFTEDVMKQLEEFAKKEFRYGNDS